MAKVFRSSVDITTAQASPLLETHLIFDVEARPFSGSPIDEFTTRLRVINSLAPMPTRFDPQLGQLVLLGAVAAVESFLRALFRRCIVLDDVCRAAAMKRDISYAAALHLNPDLLPEAILERISFTSADNIQKACRELLGISGDFSSAFTKALEDYIRVCHLRHCVVHRFGKLGASNAVHLGIDAHCDLLERPMRLDYASLQTSIAVADCFARVFNSFVFNAIVSRMFDVNLCGDYSRDGPIFRRYYAIFRDSVSLKKSPDPRGAYRMIDAQRSKFLSRN